MDDRIRIGTQGWNYPAWVGPFYPAGTRPADFLGLYARAFTTVEVDSTFYAVPPERVVRGWADRVPAGFVFALKMPREVTHERRLEGAGAVVDDFLSRARLLGPALGPVLVQLAPDFLPAHFPALAALLRTLPTDVRFAVEVRHRRWMRPDVLPELLSALSGHRVALALSDGRWIDRDTMTGLVERPTTDFHYVRWMGPDRRITDYSRVQHDRSAELEAWTRALGGSARLAVKVYGYVNNHFAGHSPATARQLQRGLGDRPVDPRELGDQITLF